MGEILKLLNDIFQMIWPFRVVHSWEMGLYFIFGRFQFLCAPGLKFVIPFFTDVHTVTMVPRSEKTPVNSITLKDGRTLTYQCCLRLQVVDAAKAYCEVDNWKETSIEVADGLLSELLTESDPKRFDPAFKKRENLRKELCEEVNAQTLKFGVQMIDVSFTQFVVGARVIRLLGDNGRII